MPRSLHAVFAGFPYLDDLVVIKHHSMQYFLFLHNRTIYDLTTMPNQSLSMKLGNVSSQMRMIISITVYYMSKPSPTQVTSLAKLMIKAQYSLEKEKPSRCRYSKFFIVDKETGVYKTLLHVVADEHRDSRSSFGKQVKHKKDFTSIAECLLSFDSSLVYDTTEGEEWEKLPVEIALVNFDDCMAELLIRAMQNKDRLVNVKSFSRTLMQFKNRVIPEPTISSIESAKKLYRYTY